MFRWGSRCVLFSKTGAGRSVPRAAVSRSPRVDPPLGRAAGFHRGWSALPGTAGTSPGAPCRRGFPGQGARTVGSQAPFPRVPVAQGPWALCVVPSCHMVPANPCETALPPERCCRAHPQLRPPGVKGQSSPSCPTCPPCRCAARMRDAVLILEVPSPLPSPSHVGSCVPWAVSGLLLPTCSVRAPVRPAPRVAAAAGG